MSVAERIALIKSSRIITEGLLLIDRYTATQMLEDCPSLLSPSSGMREGLNFLTDAGSAGQTARKRSNRVNEASFFLGLLGLPENPATVLIREPLHKMAVKQRRDPVAIMVIWDLEGVGPPTASDA
jgi:hypothetical protein